MTKIKLIVGLANPGNEYAQTRHNAGAWFIERLTQKHHIVLKNESKFFGYTGRINIQGQDIKLLIPTTFMNLSGKSVHAISKFYQINTNEILVAHDELDIFPGTAKLQFSGSHGGHNGLKDIAANLSNDLSFYRLRIGIGHPGDKTKVTRYVLNRPTDIEKNLITQAIDESVRCMDILFLDGFEATMNELHRFKAA